MKSLKFKCKWNDICLEVRQMHVWHIWINLFALRLAHTSRVRVRLSALWYEFMSDIFLFYFLLPARTKNGIRHIAHHRNVALSPTQRHKQRKKNQRWHKYNAPMVFMRTCQMHSHVYLCLYDAWNRTTYVRTKVSRLPSSCSASRHTSRIGPIVTREFSATENTVQTSTVINERPTSTFGVKTKPVLCLIACTRPH